MAFLVLTASLLQGQEQQPQPIRERVEVARVLIDARVLDDQGRAVIGLTPRDFAVTIDGTPVRVESVEWYGGSSSSEASRPGVSEAGPARPVSPSVATEPPVRGRLIVFLVQKNINAAPAAVRTRDAGLMRSLQLLDPLLAQLGADDRAAVLSFDSHLRIWTDFTSDVDRVRNLLVNDVLLRSPGPLAAAAEASLLPSLTPERGRKVSTMDEALRLIGEALTPLPGSKSVVLLGYGFGRMGPVTVLMPAYDAARAALLAARAAVFSLDITQADAHSLAQSLQAASHDTGGVYASTHLFPHLAIGRMAQALAGHYVLIVEKPEANRGLHRVEVRLVQQKGTVFTRRVFAD